MRTEGFNQLSLARDELQEYAFERTSPAALSIDFKFVADPFVEPARAGDDWRYPADGTVTFMNSDGLPRATSPNSPGSGSRPAVSPLIVPKMTPANGTATF